MTDIVEHQEPTFEGSAEAICCTRCIMNTRVDPHIQFNDNGLCNHCQRYDKLVKERVFTGEVGEQKLKSLVATIQDAGKGREYDCIIGVSGGVDSTYVAWLTKSLGLRPLAVHFDNGWNSELAVQNIESTLGKLGIDLYTYVVDWPEFRDLQLSFLKASTPDGEIPTDHAINALLWQQASKRGIRYIISGMNFATEALSVPHWAYGHSDWTYIKDVHRKFGTKPLRTYPHFTLPWLLWTNAVKRVRTISLLNYAGYDKDAAKKIITDELGWIDYGGKHYESIYTRFFQGYILPKKFSIDKRYGHLSDLINSGQMTRDEALLEIAKPAYPEHLLQQDLEFVIKKFKISSEDFDRMMATPARTFRDFRNQFDRVESLKRIVNALRARNLYPR